MESKVHRRKLLMDRSRPGAVGATLPWLDVPEASPPPEELLRPELPLPEVSEVELVRYFTHLSHLNFAVDVGFYPLGSCTMKYNPKVHEDAARLAGFGQIHPLQEETAVQGAMELMYELQGLLAKITGMVATSLCPSAGAHGEFSGMLIIKTYHHSKKDKARRIVLVPDSAHGTNPASAAMCGFQVKTICSDSQGNIDMEALKSSMSEEVAAIMLTLPNTLGLFDPNVAEICEIVHQKGGLVYGDGANMNAILGQVKLGDLGFDVVHLNLHKTFSTPHGGGGPGSGPICVGQKLASFLPAPVVAKRDSKDGAIYLFETPKNSIGKIGPFYGNFGVLVRAYAYIRMLGELGLREVSENAVINANYIMWRLHEDYRLPYQRRCMHEVVFCAQKQKTNGVSALDIAKRLIDYDFHPPTIYFPLIVEEALMIEPTETESKETLDAFVAAMKAIAREATSNPELLKSAPHNTPNTRLDETKAARQLDLRWKPQA